MKLPNANNNFLFFFILAFIFAIFMGAKNPNHFPTKLIGTWHYQRITRLDTVVFPVGNQDTLTIRADGTFCYDLALAGKHSIGTWQYIPTTKFKDEKLNKRIALTYLPSKVIRVFEFVILKPRRMIFHENGIYFEFAKK